VAKAVRTEARNMARGMEKLGVPHAALLIEERSTDTTTKREVQRPASPARNDIHRVLLVTSALHMPRASLLFRRKRHPGRRGPRARTDGRRGLGGPVAAEVPTPCGKAAARSRNTQALLALCVEGKAA
jgi:hypothetical protein